MGMGTPCLLWLALVLGSSAVSPFFLATQQTPEAYSTAQGQLASGLEVLQTTLNFLRSQSRGNSAFIRSSVATSNQDSLSLLSSQMATTQDQIRYYQSQVDYFNAVLAADSGSCLSFVTCNRCTGNRECVWCPTQQLCTAGDSQGPINGECLDFQHLSCGLECDGFEGCFACERHTNCAWCQLTMTCTDQSERSRSCGLTTDCSVSGLTGSGTNQGDTSDLDEVRGQLSAAQQTLSQYQDIATTLQSALAISPGSPGTGSPPAVFPDLSLTGLARNVDNEAQREDANDLRDVNATVNSVGQVIAGAAVGAVVQGNAQIDTQESNFGESINRTQANIEQEGAAERAAAAAARVAAAALSANSTEPEEGPVDLSSTNTPTEALNDTQVEGDEVPVELAGLNTTEQPSNETSQTEESESSGLVEGSVDLNSTDISTTSLNDTEGVEDNPVSLESSELNVTDTVADETPQADEEAGQSEELEVTSPGQNSTDISSSNTPESADETESISPDASTETPAQTSPPLPPDDSDTGALPTAVPTSFFQVPLSSFLPSL